MKSNSNDKNTSSRWGIVRSIDRRLLLACLVIIFCFAGVASGLGVYTVDFGSGFTVSEEPSEEWHGVEITIGTNGFISGTLTDGTEADTAYLVNDTTILTQTEITDGDFEFNTELSAGNYSVLVTGPNNWNSAASGSNIPVTDGELTATEAIQSEDNGSSFIQDNQVRGIRTVSLTDPTGSRKPTLEDATPSMGQSVTSSPVELSINVSDADFGTTQGDSVDVTFYDAADDSEISTDTLSANGTAVVSWSDIQGGANNWYAVATDSYGNEVTSETFSFNAPSELEIRALDTQELITTDANGDPINVEVQFFGDDGAVAQRNTTDGTISLTGLPVNERFSVSVDAGDTYVDRRILITSLIDQQTAYLLNASDTQLVRPRFTLEDPSNQFDTEESEIILERPIETANGTRFVAVTGDRFGLNGFDTTLEEGQRYRVIVRDPESGSVRRLGEYTPTASEPVTLTVQDVEFDSVSEVNGLEWGASYTSVESGADEIQFVYRDSQDTVELEYEIYERGNESNVLASGSANGNITVTESVPPSESDTVWLVAWTATRASGETLSASRPVSTSRLPVGPGLAPEWQTAISVVGLFVVAGLFGGVSPGVGGIAVASTGGFFYLISWLPGRTTGLMVLLAFFLAVLSYAARQARGATA